jgi:endonuclease/exonuclease/phosphatase family metal-dependent hydrolase
MSRRSLLLLGILSLLAGIDLQGQSLTVGSYNIRYDNPGDSGNLWKDRAPVVSALIRFHDFDVFGTQEGLIHQLDAIGAALPQYRRYGVGRDDGKSKGEHTQIFFKRDSFLLLDSGDFWLSETPGAPSIGWDAKCCNRICSWVLLQHRRTRASFYFFNAHYDHQGVVARRESSKLILQKMKEQVKDRPVVFVGDLNCAQGSEPHTLINNSGILKDAFEKVDFPYAPNGSFNAFGASKGKDIIDHIFVSKHFEVKGWGLLTDTYNGKFPSDHFPVVSRVVLK